MTKFPSQRARAEALLRRIKSTGEPSAPIARADITPHNLLLVSSPVVLSFVRMGGAVVVGRAV